jgi:uncharacterized protein DUF1161
MLRVIVAVAVMGMVSAASAQGTASVATPGMASVATPGMASETPPMQVRKPCEELKAEIDAKIKKNGVPAFSLDVVDVAAQADGKVVGTCDGQTKKIVYKRA